jgi:hypothetical protein
MALSGEAFVCSADYFNGRRVEDVVDGEGDAVWTIVYEGGGELHNFDPTIAKPTTIKGAAQTMLILGAHTDPETRTPVTEVRFGLEAVKLNPMEYAICDPNYTSGELVYPQRSEFDMPSTIDEPDAVVGDEDDGA